MEGEGFKELVDTIGKKYGSNLADKLLRGEPIHGVIAWELYEFLRKRGRIVYEDEEVDERECYVVFLEINSQAYYVLFKNNNKTTAYLMKDLRRDFVEKILEKFNKCMG